MNRQQQFFLVCLGAGLGLALSLSLAPSDAWAISPESLSRYKTALKFEQEGNLTGAIEELRHAIALDPYDQLSYIKLAALLAETYKTNEAISYYQKALTFGAQDPMVYFSMGALYEQKGDYESAEVAYDRGLRNNPAYQYGLYSIARVKTQLGKYDEALANYRKFLETYPNQFDARRNLANLLLATRQESEAAKEYKIIQDKFPERFTDHLNLAKALNRSDAPEKALEAIKQGFKDEGNRADVVEEIGNAHLSLGQTRYAIQNYKKALSMNKENPALLLKLGNIYKDLEQHDNAIDTYKSYLGKDPENYQVRHALAAEYEKNNNYKAALAELMQVREKSEQDEKQTDVEFYDLNKEIAYVNQMLGQYEDAVEQYESLLNNDLAAKDDQLKTNLAIAYHQSGELDKAAGLYRSLYYEDPQSRKSMAEDLSNVLTASAEKYLQTKDYDMAEQKYQEALVFADKKNIAPRLGLANVYYVKQENNPTYLKKAIGAYRDVLGISPDNKQAQLALAKLYVKDQQTGDARPMLEALVKENPKNSEAQLALADIYLTETDPAIQAQALTLYETVGREQPDNNTLQMSLGNLYQRFGRLDQAILQYQKLRDKDANNPMIHYNLGILYNEKGDLEKSAAAYRMAYLLDPDLLDAVYGLAVTLDKQKRYPEAIKSYEHYLRAGEADPVGGQTPAGRNKTPYWDQARERVDTLRQALNLKPETTTPTTPAGQNPSTQDTSNGTPN